MNDSLWLWLVGGVAVALGLLLAFAAGAPAPEPVVETSEAENVGEPVGSEGTETSYWEPVSASTSMTRTAAVYPTHTTWPCSVCGARTGVVETVERRLVGGCFPPDRPCERHDCPVCVRHVEAVSTAACDRCGRPVSVCAFSPCEEMPSVCGPVCAPVCPTRPGINRNLPASVDECSFFQLNATVPQPVCVPVCYQWAASRGTLLNATARDPVYFAPEVHLPCGEDVLITLTVVDSQGARYTDEIRLHVRNVP